MHGKRTLRWRHPALSLGLLSVLVGSAVMFFPQLFRPSSCVGTPSTLSIGGHSFDIAVASTSDARRAGLSDTPLLPDGHAMLFIFPDSAPREFWMKDMRYPLDIIWIGEDLRVVGFADTARPESYPESFRSPVPVRYVLETNAGVASSLSVASGTRVIFKDCH